MAIQRIEQFITALQKLESNPIAVELLCNDELNYLRNAYRVENDANDNGIYNGLATYKRAITFYRRAVYQVNSKSLAMIHLKMSESDSANFSKQTITRSFSNLGSDEIWNSHSILNMDGYIDTSVKLLNAPSYIDNILGIAALTGRRIGEIGFYSSFESIAQSDFDDEYTVYGMKGSDGVKVIGLSKKSTYAMDDKTVSAIIPTLYEPIPILESFNELRTRKKFDSHERFHNAANKELSAKVKKHYTEYLGPCASHDLRKAYVRILFDYFAELPSEAMAILIKKVLVQNSPVNYLKYSSS